MAGQRTVLAVDATRVTQLALGYWPARAFTAAGELGVYEELATNGPLGVGTLAERLGVRSPSFGELLDALVGLGVLAREGDRYSLPGEVPPSELLALGDAASFAAWAALPDVLRSGARGRSMFEEVAADPDQLARFVEVMAQASAAARAAVAALTFAGGAHILDVGGADGRLAVELATEHPDVRCTTFDLPPMTELAVARIRDRGLAERVAALAGDFFTDPLPSADVVVLSHVLLDWDEPEKRGLLASAYGALSPGGRLVVADRVGRSPSADGQRTTFDRLRSLHLLVLLGETYPYGPDDLAPWVNDAGFVEVAFQAIDGDQFLATARRPPE
jgi:predicted O-methyltransferase YrrM